MTRPIAAPPWRRCAAAAALVLAVAVAPARADVLLNTTRTVATNVVAVERALTVATAGTLEVEVVDQAVPAALGSIRVVVTRGDVVIGTPLTAAGRLTFDAVANSEYVIRVLGRPATGQPAGAVGVTVTRAADPAPKPRLLEFNALFQSTTTNPLNFTAEQTITIPQAGNYVATLTDFQFPAALTSVRAFLFFGSQAIAQIAPGAPVALNNLVATTPGSATQYKLVLSADASTTARAGLFGLRLTGGPSNNVVYDVATPVGELEAAEAFTNPAAGSLTLQVRDAAFPSALTQVGAVMSSGGVRVGAPVFGTNSAAATAPAGPLQLWTTGTAGANPGSYQASVAVTAGATLVTRVRAVSSSAPNAPEAFLYPINLASPGGYRARVTDFQFPSSLQSIQFAVLQNGTPIVQSTTGGVLDFNAVAGAVQLYVVAQAPNGGSGLFGAEILTTNTPPSNLLDRTQAVGALSDGVPVVATTAGRYDVTLKDLGWPANFTNLALAVTRGGQVVGRIFGGGTFFFDATPGSYLATLVATPNATEAAGLYSVAIRSTVPTVTLTANPTSVQAGQSTQLTWSSTAATSCVASGGWSGARTLSNSESVGPLNSNSTFSLACTGPGGTTTASASVTVTAAPSSGGGGGGAFGLLGLAMLGLVAGLQRARRARASAV